MRKNKVVQQYYYEFQKERKRIIFKYIMAEFSRNIEKYKFTGSRITSAKWDR